MHRTILKHLSLLILAAIPVICQAQQLKHVSPEKVGMDSRRLLKADSIIEDAIRRGDIPGAVLAVVRHDKIAYRKPTATDRCGPWCVR